MDDSSSDKAKKATDMTQVSQQSPIPDKARQTIEAFLAEDDDGLGVSAPEANDIEVSTETKAKKLEAQAKAEGDMGDTTDSMNEDTK